MAGMEAMAKKRISQQTFDETVRENIDDFEMEKDEALADAIQQFKSQGVDLTNIDTSGTDRTAERDALANALEVIKTAKDALHDGKPIAAEECINAMAALRTACAGAPKTEMDADPTVADESTLAAGAGEGEGEGSAPNSTATPSPAAPVRNGPGVATNKSIIAMAKGPDSLAAFLPFVALAPAALDTLCAVCEDSVENRDSFPSIAIAVLAKLLGASMADADTVRRCCTTIAVLTTRTEDLKAMFVKKEVGGLRQLLTALKTHNTDPLVVVAACQALRSVCSFDDLRRDFSGAYDASRAAVELGMIPELITAFRAFPANGEVICALCSAMKVMACNDDAVQQIQAGGGVPIIIKCLEDFPDSAPVCQRAAAVVRNLSGNDDVKTTLCQGNCLPLLLTATQTHMEDAPLAEHVMASLAAMALRRPTNCERIVELNGIRQITLCMRRFPKVAAVQRACCLTVRNLVGRCPELMDPLLGENMEELLRAAGKVPGSVDAAYAALRDLKLEATMVTMNADGQIQVGVEEFGARKSAFNPVYDDGDANIEDKMSAAAQSPAALGYNM